jgi:hypothetical protein
MTVASSWADRLLFQFLPNAQNMRGLSPLLGATAVVGFRLGRQRVCVGPRVIYITTFGDLWRCQTALGRKEFEWTKEIYR